ncbi:MAG: glycosyl hydrolase family 28 protein [Spirochaetes bacterium]|nr:glycosyl hydrolase family 28 protein [Spirochaetota bacterium]
MSSLREIYNITEFGAKGDNHTINSLAIQKAIDTAYQNGGGVVQIPPGKYITGTIFLKDHIVLDIQKGATLIASTHLSDYVRMSMGHNKDRQPYHLMVLNQVKDVSIRGGGVIQGRGKEFWYPKKGPQANPGNYKWYKSREARISPLVEIIDSKNISLSDFTLTQSPGWTLHIHCCNSVFIRGIRILNNLFGPNTDGIDINGCRDVIISDCQIRTGDDAIVVKTTPDSRTSERITITNCILQTNCVALKLGATESYHDMRQITISNCIIHKSNRGIGFYSLNGGIFEDITISNIICDTHNGMLLNRPIHFDQRGLPEKAKQGTMRNIHINNFVAKTNGRILLTAQTGTFLENIVLRDIHLSYGEVENAQKLADQIESGKGTFSNFNPAAREANAALVVENIKNLLVDNFTIDWPENKPDFDFIVCWGKSITESIMNNPLVKPVHQDNKKYFFEDSQVNIIS